MDFFETPKDLVLVSKWTLGSQMSCRSALLSVMIFSSFVNECNHHQTHHHHNNNNNNNDRENESKNEE
jgi:transcription elongation factor Elf1